MILVDKRQFEPFRKKLIEDFETIKKSINDPSLNQFWIDFKHVQALSIQLKVKIEFFVKLL
jgi:hypothetical protein